MSDAWKFGIGGLCLIVVGFSGIVLIIGVDIDWRVLLEIVGVLFFLALVMVGAKMCLIGLE